MSGYRTQSPDTSIEAEKLLIARYREMSPVEKLAIVRALTHAVDELAVAGARLRHPGESDAELRMRVAAARLSPEIMEAAFGGTEAR